MDKYLKKGGVIINPTKKKSRWMYDGPVYYFSTVVKTGRFVTEATNKEKAISNICFRAKKELGYTPNARVTIQNNKVKEVLN